MAAVARALGRLPKGAEIKVEGQFYSFAVHIGKQRNARNRRARVREQMFSRRDPEEISVQGVIGEVGFLQAFGLSLVPLYDTRPRSAKTESEFDAVLCEGETVDVKTTFPGAQGLLVRRNKASNPPAYYALITLLAKCDKSQVAFLRFDGFVHSQRVFETEEYWKPDLWGGVYLVPRPDLLDLTAVRQHWPPLPLPFAHPWEAEEAPGPTASAAVSGAAAAPAASGASGGGAAAASAAGEGKG